MSEAHRLSGRVNVGGEARQPLVDQKVGGISDKLIVLGGFHEGRFIRGRLQPLIDAIHWQANAGEHDAIPAQRFVHAEPVDDGVGLHGIGSGFNRKLAVHIKLKLVITGDLVIGVAAEFG